MNYLLMPALIYEVWEEDFFLIRLYIFTSEVVKSFEQYSCNSKDIPKICNKPWIISSLCDKAG